MNRHTRGVGSDGLRPRDFLSELLNTSSLSKWPLEARLQSPRTLGAVQATFLGVSTVLFDDGVNGVLTDGFFSRPNILQASMGKIRPNKRRISTALSLPGFDHLDAVVVSHSHYDHALDSATVAKKTGAWLIGSQSTQEIATGAHFHNERFIPFRNEETHHFGQFAVTTIESVHSPDDRVPGVITSPIAPPTRMTNYRTGDTLSILIEHQKRSVLIHGSAGFIPGALEGRHAETVYLGVGLLGKQTDSYREEYWNEVVTAVGATRVVPVHWDNFTRSLARPIRPMPRPLEDIAIAFSWLQQRAERAGITFEVPRISEPVNPWP